MHNNKFRQQEQLLSKSNTDVPTADIIHTDSIFAMSGDSSACTSDVTIRKINITQQW